MRFLPLAVLAGLTAPAAAESRSSPTVAKSGNEVELPIAIGVNSPLSWYNGFSYGLSLSVGLAHHHAIRANVARYDYVPTEELLPTAEEVPGSSGKIMDISAGYVWYPRALWDGFTVEAGVLRRDRDTRFVPEFDDTVETHTTTYAGRAMVGWSWKLLGYGFLAVGAGLSVGREGGEETRTPDAYPTMSTTHGVDRLQVDAEGYIRIGVAFGR